MSNAAEKLLAEITPAIHSTYVAALQDHPSTDLDYQRGFLVVYATALMRQAAMIAIEAGVPLENFMQFRHDQYQAALNERLHSGLSAATQH